MAKVIIWLLIFLSHLNFANIANAKPLLAINQQLWNEKTKMVIANCPKNITNVAKIHCLRPVTEDKTFNILDMVIVNDRNIQYIYMVSSEKNATVSILYRFDMTADITHFQEENVVYRLPFGAASAKLKYTEIQQGKKIIKDDSDANKNQQSYLLLTANESEHSARLRKTEKLSKPSASKNGIEEISPQCFATIFELNGRDRGLTPLEQFSEGMQGSLKELSSAILIKLPNEHKAVILAGSDKNEDQSTLGAIRVVFLESIKSSLMFRTNTKHQISQMLAVDQQQKNRADMLYAWDKGGGLWKIDLKNLASMQKVLVENIFPQDHEHSIIAVKSMEQPGINFYFIGDLTGSQNKENTNVYRLDLPLEGKPSLRKLSYSISEKEKNTSATFRKFAAIFVRFGRLILVPEQFDPRSSQPCTVLELSLKGEKPLTIPIPWKILEGIPVSESMSSLTQIYLLWDTQQQQEVLVSLNQNCDLHLLTAPITQDKYRRMSWKKIRK